MSNTKKTKVNTLQTKRFVIRKSLIGKNTVIVFTNHKGDKCEYNHDVVYNQLKDKFECSVSKEVTSVASFFYPLPRLSRTCRIV